MRNLGATGLAAALCAGLALAAARADDADGGDLRSLPPVKPSWWSGMFGGNPPAAAPKKATAAEAAPTPRKAPADPATLRAREENAFLRRQSICDELVEIANKIGDDALRERAYQLNDKAWAVYQQRTNASATRAADAAALSQPVRIAPDPNRRAAAEAAPWTKRGE
jgi:hypothetical protein